MIPCRGDRGLFCGRLSGAALGKFAVSNSKLPGAVLLRFWAETMLLK